MHIVIGGASSVGLHIASVLSANKHSVFLIDRDAKKLAEASLQLDIATRQGSVTDWRLLEALLESEPSVFVSITQDDETNLVACCIAKHLGYPCTIARLQSTSYLNQTRLDFRRMFGIDHFVEPDILVASDILKYILQPDSVAIESFAHGAVLLRTILIPEQWASKSQPLAKLNLPEGMMVGLIRRHNPIHQDDQSLGDRIIIPHGGDIILPGDEVTFIGEADVISELPKFFGLPSRKIKSVVIFGGSRTGSQLAAFLTQHNISVRLIDPDYDTCCRLAKELPECNILHHGTTDLMFLHAERIERADLCVACTDNDETNILTALQARESGSHDVITTIRDLNYVPLIGKLQLPHVVSARTSAANRILSLILSRRITSVVSLYDNRVEIMEIQVSPNSQVVGIPLMELGPLMPKDFLIAMIQNRGRIIIANGSRIISPGDTVVAISTRQHVKDLERIF